MNQFNNFCKILIINEEEEKTKMVMNKMKNELRKFKGMQFK